MNEKKLRFEGEWLFRALISLLFLIVFLIDFSMLVIITSGKQLYFDNPVEKIVSIILLIFGLPFLFLLNQSFPPISLNENGIVLSHIFVKVKYSWDEISEVNTIRIPFETWFLVIDTLPVIYLFYGITHLRKFKRGIVIHPKLIGSKELIDRINSEALNCK